MTFDSHSLERLKELGRKLPKEVSKPQSKNQKESKTEIPYPGAGSPAGASYPAAGPGASCRLPGRPFFGKYFRKNSESCSTDSRDQKNIRKKYKKLQTLSKKYRYIIFS